MMSGEQRASPVTPDGFEVVEASMRRGDFAAALSLLGKANESDSPKALYLNAVCLRYLGRLDDALTILERLRDSAPEYARAWQERGHLQRRRGDVEGALDAFREAVRLNPGLLASWRSLAELEQQVGASERAETARRQAQRLADLPRELVTVTSLLHEGKLYKAEQICRAFLQQHPQHVEAMRLLAQLGLQLNVLDDAEFLLESALAFEPDNAFVRYDYVTVLGRRQKFAQALEQAERLRQAQPGNPSFEMAFANQCMAAGDFDRALAAYDQILARMPDHPGVHLSRGHALKTTGDSQGAVAAYRAAARARPTFGDAWWSLANLKTYRFADKELEQMRQLEAAPRIAPVDRYHLCFALGKALEDAQAYAESFEYYQRGNQLKTQELRYDPESVSAEMARQQVVCTPGFFDQRTGAGYKAPDPIFIVGLPRAGSTLIEQILASHSQVDGTLELPNVLALVHRLNGRRKVDETPRYPDILNEIDADRFREFGQAYIDETRMHRQGAPRFVDKMPNNFRHLGLIATMLPEARIIDARRHPMDCCFSGYKQLFGEGQEFSYDLTHIGRYYREYVELMDYWQRVLPGRILRVQYEDVVADLEGQVHRMLNFLGLPFESECLAFHKTQRLVRTASAEQVRQPINASGMARWRHYEAWLDPLKKALGAALSSH